MQVSFICMNYCFYFCIVIVIEVDEYLSCDKFDIIIIIIIILFIPLCTVINTGDMTRQDDRLLKFLVHSTSKNSLNEYGHSDMKNVWFF